MNPYADLKPEAAYAKFEGAVFEALGIESGLAAENAFRTLDTVGKAVGPVIKEGGCYELAKEAQEVLWSKSYRLLRVALTIGRISSDAWGSHRRKRRECEYLYPRDAVQLTSFAARTNDTDIPVDTILAANKEFMTIRRQIPDRLVPWSAEIFKIANDEQKQRISDSLIKIGFSDHHVDSEDSFDPHPSDKFLHDEELPAEFRQLLLTRAIDDATSTNYKPTVWLSQLEITLKSLARAETNGLRFEARRRLGLPESDEDYTTHQQSLRDETEARSAEKIAFRETRLALKRDLIEPIIAAAVQDSLHPNSVFLKPL